MQIIDFTSELIQLDMVKRFKQALKAQPYIKVVRPDDLGKGQQGNVPCR